MLTPAEADYICEHSFFSPFNWETSCNGNPYRHWRGYFIVIFPTRGGYGFLIKDNKGNKKFSNRVFESEDDAISGSRACLTAMGVG